jgi:hypothetical protein
VQCQRRACLAIDSHASGSIRTELRPVDEMHGSRVESLALCGGFDGNCHGPQMNELTG